MFAITKENNLQHHQVFIIFILNLMGPLTSSSCTDSPF